MNDFGKAPRRAWTLTCVVGGDTKEDLMDAVTSLLDCMDRDELSIGIHGGPRNGAIYELLTNEDMTHAQYFKYVQEYLSGKQEGDKK